MSNKFSVEAIFKATDRFSDPVRKMQRDFERFAKGAASGLRGANDIVDGFASGLKKVGLAAVGATAVASVALKEVVDTGAQFEKTLVSAAAKFSPEIRQGTAEFERLRKTAEDVGAATEFNAQQAAAGLKDLASAGFGVNQAIAALPGVVDLATAAEVELSAASEIASKSLGAFGLKTNDATQLGINLARVNDNLARTADATSASIEGLFESIKEGGPVAASTGASVETFMALAGQLSEAGIEGSNAGTTLKNVFLSLSAPTNEAANALKKLGVTTKDSKGNLRDVIDIFGDLEKKTAKMGTATKAGTLEQIFGKIPIAGVTSLLDAGSDKIRALRVELEHAGGSTARMAAIMRDTTQGDIDGFTSAIDGVKIAIFGVISGPLRGLLKGMTDWIGANRELVATKVNEFLEKAPALLSAFSSGLKEGFAGVKPVIEGALGPFRSFVDLLVGKAEKDPVGSARELGKTVAEIGIAFGGFALATKAAAGATFLYEMATTAASMASFVWGGIVRGLTAAIGFYELASKAGVGATIAMSFASKLATADAILNTGATWANQAAAWARNAALEIGTLATTEITAATIVNTVKTGLNTAATWAKQAAQFAVNAITKAGTTAVELYTAATSAETIKSGLSTAAAWARQAAQVAKNAALGLGAGAMDLYAIATGSATVATEAGTAAATTATGAWTALGLAIGAAVAALAAWMVAYQQNEDLKAQNGGMGIFDIAGGMIDQGTFDPFEVVDKHMNEQAKAEAAKRQVVNTSGGGAGSEVSGTINVNAPPGTTVATPKGSPVGLKLAKSGAM